MESPDNWNSGIISQTVAKFHWRLNGLDATNDDLSAFFIVVNTPSVVTIALPFGQKTGIIPKTERTHADLTIKPP